MREISAGLAAYLAQPGKSRVVCCEILRVDGTAERVTTYYTDLVIDGNTYSHGTGGELSDIESTMTLDVDNAEIRLPKSAISGITESDVRAGLYRGASVEVFFVNPDDLTQGRFTPLKKTIGQITIQRNQYVVELRGVMDALQQAFGAVCTPSCRYRFGDPKTCKVDVAALAVTGTIDAVSADGRTFRDAARTEPGPSGAIAITAISNANPGVVTLASAPPANGTGMILAHITTPGSLNGTTIVRNRSGNTFELGVDTSNTTNYPPYTGSGTATPIGADAGKFAYGVMTVTKNGITISREVKSYTLGQWTIHEAFPFTIEVGDAYTMTPGCSKTPDACKSYDNYVAHFGGFDKVPLMDSIKQIGKPA